MDNYKYKISVVMPIYNVEKYLEESILSVINQTIGFDNIQLILVNDGSPDNCEEICLKYREKYPNNIVYLKQKNKGVSAARNNGIKYIMGKYVSFLDSDDKWEKHAFKRVWDFFEKNYDEVDVADCRVKYFDALDGYHIFDKKYNKTRIVDLEKEFDFPLLNAPTAFFKSKAISEIRFDERLRYSEDTKFINEVLLIKCKYAIVHDVIYLYRKRADENSAVDNRFNIKDYYISTLNNCFQDLILLSKKKYGCIKNFIQYLVLNNIVWRINLTDSSTVLNAKEQKEYYKIIVDLLKNIDDDIILNKKTAACNKIYLLEEKHQEKAKFGENTIYFDNDKEYNFDNINVTYFKNRVLNNKLVIHGRLTPLVTDDSFEYFLRDPKTNKKYYPKMFNIKNLTKYSCSGKIISKTYLFKVVLPIKEDSYEVENCISYGKKIWKCGFRVTSNNKLSPNYSTYISIAKKCIINRKNENLEIEKYSFTRLIKREIKCLYSLFIKLKIKTLMKRIINPIICFINNIKHSLSLKNIILLESNPDYTDNTKEVFDLLIREGVNEKYKIVWLVSDSKPFSNIHIKNVEFLEFFNISKAKRDKHVNYCYEHAKIILDANKYVKKANPKQIRIHLNHGSPFKNAVYYNLNIGEVDYDIVQSNFFAPVESEVRDLSQKKIIPLGFPRNDVLYSNKKVNLDIVDDLKTTKTILWLPTYRNHANYNNSKVSLKYGLPCVNNEKELYALNDRLNKNKVTLIIKFHPAENTELLQKCDLSNILVIKNEDLIARRVTLYELFNKVDALITDYSSVYFDFCLTKKNIGLAISDIDEYIKEAGEFLSPYKESIIGNYMYSNKDLLNFVDDVSTGIDRTYKKRMKLINRYDDYRDGKATERVYEFLKKFL